ncbi:hypothetical protein POL68_07200 [Stigmatella sp. ncwal1]|uniref:Uncharacterized protein n=1 Tax=Stigmatella ashevillensis TaxID=2995309 RepID=A0ABT5D544_9BACT|nr:hypothetical protein [Stigmatella ashevillena]MDC0708253.1 hypothetical protein [Stigmatella ashevillena]
MKVFEEMGRLLQEQWRRAHHDEQAFPDIAAGVLETLAPYQNFEPMEPLSWLYKARLLPRQLTIHPGFGQPPLTVFSDHRFVIDLYYWIDGTTDIHQHGFSGAFQVLHGGSIHGHYRWTEERRINSRMAFGELALHSINELRVGDIQRIPSGRSYIHSLFHLDRPSVTCVVRTLNDPEAGPQYAYRKPGLAVDALYENVHLAKVEQSLSLLVELSHPMRSQLISELISNNDLYTTYVVFLRLVKLTRRLEVLDEFWDVAIRTHGALAERLIPVFKETVRQSALFGKRELVKEPEHRYFLALLLNVDDVEGILRMVRQRYPGEEPVELIMKWVTTLCGPADAAQAGDTLGIPLDEPMLVVFRQMLLGCPPPQIIERLKETFEIEDEEREVPHLMELMSALRTSPVFRPLFSSWPPSDTSKRHQG